MIGPMTKCDIAPNTFGPVTIFGALYLFVLRGNTVVVVVVVSSFFVDMVEGWVFVFVIYRPFLPLDAFMIASIYM